MAELSQNQPGFGESPGFMAFRTKYPPVEAVST
jgi:hypothetical protein